ncbi:MAG: hypothetical protein KatS3mg052_0658 [Candidatus Roseilinea sp.]|nr:MAG: hypothetical protein KatS3mg052_0658 [Candidatus Roseilinea sp.]
MVVNKWDLIESAEKVARTAQPVEGLGLLTAKMQDFLKLIQERLNFMAYVPVLFVSAKTGFRADHILPDRPARERGARHAHLEPAT